MPRLVRHDALGPIELPPSDKSYWVCACGLSQNMPYCDGSHKQCRKNEEPGKTYVYDDERKSVVEVKDE